MGGVDFSVGFLVDSLTAMMMVVVTSVSLMVHIYTIGYMHDEEVGYQRFFSYISLFTFSMLMLIMSNNFIQLFFGWEAVGLVSYLLIGFYFKRDSAIFANLKAFLVNRVGDFVELQISTGGKVGDQLVKLSADHIRNAHQRVSVLLFGLYQLLGARAAIGQHEVGKALHNFIPVLIDHFGGNLTFVVFHF